MPMFSIPAVNGIAVVARPRNGTVSVVLTIRKVDGVDEVSCVKPFQCISSVCPSPV